MKKNKQPIGGILTKSNLISEEELEYLLYQSKIIEKRIGESAVELGYISEQEMIRVLSEHTGIPIVELKYVEINKDILSLLPYKYCYANKIMPYKVYCNKLFIAMVDPLNSRLLDDIAIKLNVDIITAICGETDLLNAFDKYKDAFFCESASEVLSINVDKRPLKIKLSKAMKLLILFILLDIFFFVQWFFGFYLFKRLF